MTRTEIEIRDTIRGAYHVARKVARNLPADATQEDQRALIDSCARDVARDAIKAARTYEYGRIEWIPYMIEREHGPIPGPRPFIFGPRYRDRG